VHVAVVIDREQRVEVRHVVGRADLDARLQVSVDHVRRVAVVHVGVAALLPVELRVLLARRRDRLPVPVGHRGLRLHRLASAITSLVQQLSG